MLDHRFLIGSQINLNLEKSILLEWNVPTENMSENGSLTCIFPCKDSIREYTGQRETRNLAHFTQCFKAHYSLCCDETNGTIYWWSDQNVVRLFFVFFFLKRLKNIFLWMLESLAACLIELSASDFYWIFFSFRLSLIF